MLGGKHDRNVKRIGTHIINLDLELGECGSIGVNRLAGKSDKAVSIDHF